MDAQALSASFASGEEESLAQMIELYGQPLLRYCHHILCDYHEAQDAVQITFCKAYTHRRRFRPGTNLSAWLYRLAYTTCVDLLRREGRHRAAAGLSLDDEELNLDVPDPARSPQDEAERRELRESIDRGLAALSPEHRQVLVLREIHQLRYDEIADVLSLDVGTVKSRISRARKQLRKFLLECGNFSPPSASKGTEKEG